MNQLGSGRIEPSRSEIQLVRDMEQFSQRVTQNVLVIANQDYNNFMVRQQVEQATQLANMRAHWTIQLSRMSMEAEAQIFVTNAIREIEDRERLRIETFYAAMRHLDERIQSDKTAREQSVRADFLRLWSEHVDEIRDRIQREIQNSSEFQAALLSAVMANDQVYQAQLSAKEEEIKELRGLLDDIRSDVVGLRQGSEWVRSLEKELNTRKADLLQSQNSIRQLQNENHRITAELSMVTAQRDEMNTLKKMADSDVANLQSECKDLARSLKELSKVISDLKLQHLATTEEIKSEWGRQISVLEIDLHRIKEENDELARTNAKLDVERVKTFEEGARISQIQLELESARDQIQSEIRNSAGLRDANSVLIRVQTSKEMEIARLYTEIMNLKSSANSREKYIRDLEDLWKNPDARGAFECPDCPRLEKALSDAEGKARLEVREASAKIASLELALDVAAQNFKDERQKSESDLDEIRTERETRIQELEAQLESMGADWATDKANFENQVAVLEDERKILRSELAERSEDLKTLGSARMSLIEIHKKIAELRNVIDRHKESIRDHENTSLELSGLVRDRDRIIKTLKENNRTLQSEYEILVSTNTSLHKTIQAKDQRLSLANKTIDQLRGGFKPALDASGLEYTGFSDHLSRTEAASISSVSGPRPYRQQHFHIDPTLAFVASTQVAHERPSTSRLGQDQDQVPPLTNPDRFVSRPGFSRHPIGDGGDGGSSNGGGDGPFGSQSGSGHGRPRTNPTLRDSNFGMKHRSLSFSDLLKFAPKLAGNAEKSQVKLFLSTIDEVLKEYRVPDSDILRILNVRLMESNHPKISKWWADEASLNPFNTWAQAKNSLGKRFAETIDSSLVREYILDGMQRSDESIREFGE
ncbi:unnamed protein product [Aphanomyces euteiches]